MRRRKSASRKKTKSPKTKGRDEQSIVSLKEDPLFSFWLSKSSKGKGFSHCKVCSTDIVSKNGISDIKKHSEGRKHKDNLSSKAMQLLSSFWSMAPGKSLTRDKTNFFSHLMEEEYPEQPPSSNYSPYRYNIEWEEMPVFSSWVSPSPNGDDYAFCTLCSVHLALYFGGMKALRRHASCKKHIQTQSKTKSNGEIQAQPKTVSSNNRISLKVESESDEDASEYADLLSASYLEIDEPSNSSNLNSDEPSLISHQIEVRQRKYTRRAKPKLSGRSFGRSMGGSKGYYLYKYQPDWQLHPFYSDWLAPSKLGDAHAFCMYCKSDLTIMASGRTGLNRHAFSKKHRMAAQADRVYPQIRSPSQGGCILVEPGADDEEIGQVLLKIEEMDSSYLEEEQEIEFEDMYTIEEKYGSETNTSQYHSPKSQHSSSKHDSISLKPDSPSLEPESPPSSETKYLSPKLDSPNLKCDSSAIFRVKTNNSETGSNKKRFKVSTLRNIYKYLPEWEASPLFSEWLSPSTKGEDYAFCKLCAIDIIIHNLGEINLKIHATTRNHKQSLNKDMPITKFDVGNGVKFEIMDQSESSEITPKISSLNCDDLALNSSYCVPEKTVDICLSSSSKSSLKTPLAIRSQSEKLMSEYYKHFGYKIQIKYNPRWEIDPYFSDWVAPSPKGDAYAYCKCCACNLAIYTAGKGGLDRHARTPKHQEKVKALRSKNNQNEDLDSNLLSSQDSKSALEDDKSLLSQAIETTLLGKKKFIQYYNPKWERDPLLGAWLGKSSLGREYAYCKACMKDLLIRAGRKADLITHARSKRHLRFMTVMPAVLPDRLVETNFLSETIEKQLPRVEASLIKKLVKLIVDHLGVEYKDDLQHLEAKDFETLLKPVQARKLIQAWREDCTPMKSDDPQKITSHPSPPNDDLCNSLSDLNDLTTVTQFRSRVSIDHPSLDDPTPTVMDQVTVDVPSTMHSFEPSTVDTLCLEDPTYLPQSKKLHKPDKVSDEDMNMKKSIWVDDFCVPSERLTPEVMNLLQNGENLGESHLGDLVRAFANQIYEIVKRPHINDLRIISRKVTDEFPSLKDTEGDCSFQTFFDKLKNRMYALRKRKSALLRRERKKILKQIVSF